MELIIKFCLSEEKKKRNKKLINLDFGIFELKFISHFIRYLLSLIKLMTIIIINNNNNLTRILLQDIKIIDKDLIKNNKIIFYQNTKKLISHLKI